SARDEIGYGILFDLLHFHSGVADGGTLIFARQETGTPVILTPVAERRLNGDETGQVLIFRAETVEHPGTHTRALELKDAGVKLEEGGTVVHAVADHRPDHAEVIHALADMGKEVAHGNAALAVLFEGPGRFHEAADAVLSEGQTAFEGNRLSVVALEARFG